MRGFDPDGLLMLGRPADHVRDLHGVRRRRPVDIFVTTSQHKIPPENGGDPLAARYLWWTPVPPAGPPTWSSPSRRRRWWHGPRFDGQVTFVTGGHGASGGRRSSDWAKGARVTFCDLDADVSERSAAEIGERHALLPLRPHPRGKVAAVVSAHAGRVERHHLLINDAGVNTNST